MKDALAEYFKKRQTLPFLAFPVNTPGHWETVMLDLDSKTPTKFEHWDSYDWPSGEKKLEGSGARAKITELQLAVVEAINELSAETNDENIKRVSNRLYESASPITFENSRTGKGIRQIDAHNCGVAANYYIEQRAKGVPVNELNQRNVDFNSHRQILLGRLNAEFPNAYPRDYQEANLKKYLSSRTTIIDSLKTNVSRNLRYTAQLDSITAELDKKQGRYALDTAKLIDLQDKIIKAEIELEGQKQLGPLLSGSDLELNNERIRALEQDIVNLKQDQVDTQKRHSSADSEISVLENEQSSTQLKRQKVLSEISSLKSELRFLGISDPDELFRVQEARFRDIRNFERNFVSSDRYRLNKLNELELRFEENVKNIESLESQKKSIIGTNTEAEFRSIISGELEEIRTTYRGLPSNIDSGVLNTLENDYAERIEWLKKLDQSNKKIAYLSAEQAKLGLDIETRERDFNFAREAFLTDQNARYAKIDTEIDQIILRQIAPDVPTSEIESRTSEFKRKLSTGKVSTSKKFNIR